MKTFSLQARFSRLPQNEPRSLLGKSPHTLFAGLRADCGMSSHSTSLQRMTFPAASILLVAGICLLGSQLPAQISGQPVPPPVQLDSQKLTMEELSQILAPIALYPDALIALILPASTVPSDVVLGARFVKANGDPADVEKKPWDDSVKALARYPEVLTWLDENLEWTSSVGEAFVEQPADVMNSIQGLREQARATGHLVDTPQQKVIKEEQVIRIVPADPEVIYVPVYDPQVVYIESYTTFPALTFGLGFAVGSWLTYDFDWNRRCVYQGNWRGWNHDRENSWNGDRNGNRGGVNLANIDIDNANQWQPSANAQRQTNQRQRNNNGNARYATTRTAGTTQPVARQNSNPQSITYNPVSNPALPRPTNLERTSRGYSRDQAPGRSVTPLNEPARAGALPPTPEGSQDRPDQPRTQTPGIQNALPSSPSPTTGPTNPGTTPERPNRPRPIPSVAPEVTGLLQTPGQPRKETDAPRQPKQQNRVVPAPTVPGQEQSAPRPQQGPSVQKPRSKAPQESQQPPVTNSQTPPQSREQQQTQRPPQVQREQRPPQIQNQEQAPQLPPQQRPAPVQQPQTPSVQQAPPQQRPAPAPKPQTAIPQQQATPQIAPVLPVPAAPPGADRSRKRRD